MAPESYLLQSRRPLFKKLIPRTALARLLVFGFLISASLVYVAPQCYWTCIGLWRNEPFFRWKPASYWSAELGRWEFTNLMSGGFRGPKTEDLQQMIRSPRWKLELLLKLPSAIFNRLPIFVYNWSVSNSDKGRPPLVDDPAAIPVLTALAKYDKQYRVRIMAALGMATMLKDAKVGLIELAGLDSERDGYWVRHIAIEALKQISDPSDR